MTGDAPGSGPPARPDADEAVDALYREHAGNLVRLAIVIIRDREMAEDVVQEAFCSLFRHWGGLSGPDKAPAYVRASVLNGCRAALRYRGRRTLIRVEEPTAASAEADALIGEEHRALLAGLRALPPRQREVLALRYFCGLNVAEIAEAMVISQGCVKSTASRAIRALGHKLGADSE